MNRYEVWTLRDSAPVMLAVREDRTRALTLLRRECPRVGALSLGPAVLEYTAESSAAQRIALAGAIAGASRDAARPVLVAASSRPVRPALITRADADIGPRDRWHEEDEEDEDEDPPTAASPALRAAPAPAKARAHRAKPTASTEDIERRALQCVAAAGSIERLERLVEAAFGGDR